MEFNDYVQQAVIFFQKGKLEQAIENFEAALKIEPNNEQIKQLYSNCKQMISFKEQQCQLLANEAKQRADVIGIELRDVDKIIGDCTENLKQNINDTSLKGYLAKVYYIRGLLFFSKMDYKSSINDFNEAINNQPDYIFAFNKRGLAYKEIENYDLAIKDFENILQYKPDDSQSKVHLSNTYIKRGIDFDRKGDKEHAISDFETALKYNPDDKNTREILQMVKSQVNKNN
ncbi:MAG: tetratricopeptide repeat protein [Treponema sp.]|jgi:tetratricopeptide (TPR) repeat protein|nr:tetratricopeptide repeat protein [Treponema sp.]